MKALFKRILLCVPLLGCASLGASAGTLFESNFEGEATLRAHSSFDLLAEDRIVERDESALLLARTLYLREPARVLVIADGRAYPLQTPVAQAWIEIDESADASSKVAINWSDTNRPVQHTVTALAYAELKAGWHNIGLRVGTLPHRPGRFGVGADTALAVFVEPSGDVLAEYLQQEGPIDLTTYDPDGGIDVTEGGADRPFVPLLEKTLRNTTNAPQKVVTLAAGRVFHSCSSFFNSGHGDALVGLWSDGICPTTSAASWAVNDVDPDAELQAPITLHGISTLPPGGERTLALGASELAFGSDQEGSTAGASENDVCYDIADTKLIHVQGSRIAGGNTTAGDFFCSTYTWRCIATTKGSFGCPEAGTEVVLGSAEIDIPADHDGILYFSAKTRIQGGNDDSFATGRLRIRINGEIVGSLGVQQLAENAGEASRTLSASYLSAPRGNSAVLPPGRHRVEAVFRIDGEALQWPSAPADLALTWFD